MKRLGLHIIVWLVIIIIILIIGTALTYTGLDPNRCPGAEFFCEICQKHCAEH